MSFSFDGILMFRYGQAWSTQYLMDDTRCPSGFGCVPKNVTERTTTTATTTTTKTTTTTTAATTTVTTSKGMSSSFVIRNVPVLLLLYKLSTASMVFCSTDEQSVGVSDMLRHNGEINVVSKILHQNITFNTIW